MRDFPGIQPDNRLMTSSNAAMAVFLVEDNELIRENLTIALEEVAHACLVGCAAREDEAVAWLTAHPTGWDIAVIDLFLKQGSGLGVLHACVARSAHQRAVVLSNYATEDMRRRCLQGGADRVFDKSTELDAFLAYCGEALR